MRCQKMMLLIAFAASCICTSAFAQLIKSTDGGLRFDERLAGEWQLVSSEGNGQPVRNSYYGRFVIKDNELFVPTANGDYAYKIASADESRDPAEIKMVDQNRKLSKVMLFQFANDQLTITSSVQSAKVNDMRVFPAPSPQTPAANQTYVLARAERPETTDRPKVGIKLLDGETNKVLLERTIKSFVGGKLNYDPMGDTEQSSIIRIKGSISTEPASARDLALSIEIKGPVSSEDPVSKVSRVDTIEIETKLSTGESKRIACGGHIWCELKVE